MTKIIEQFSLASAALASGASNMAPSGVLPNRIEPNFEPLTLNGAVDGRSASMHYEFNQRAGKIFDRINPSLGAQYVGEVIRNNGIGKELAIYTENSAITFGTAVTDDLVIPGDATNTYAVDDTWTLEVMAYIDTANVTTLAKYDGTADVGWILRCANPSNQEFEFELRDGTTTMTIRCNTGVDLRGSVTGAHQFAVTLNGSGASIANTDIELYLDGVQQTKNIVNAGPVNAYSDVTQAIEAGNFPSGGPLIGAPDRGDVTFDQIMMYPSVLTAARLLAHFQIANLTRSLPTATWTYTAAGAETVNAAAVPGMLGGLLPGQDRLFTNQVKVKTYYSKNAGARTEFRESVSGLSVALVASDTFEVIAEWQQASTFDTGPVGWVADACGNGPWIIYDDGAADVAPGPPIPLSDTSVDGLSVTLEIQSP